MNEIQSPNSIASENCYTCKFFAELKAPQDYGDGINKIYRYCSKGSKNMCQSGYPVYISEGKCDKYKKRSRSGRYKHPKRQKGIYIPSTVYRSLAKLSREAMINDKN